MGVIDYSMRRRVSALESVSPVGFDGEATFVARPIGTDATDVAILAALEGGSDVNGVSSFTDELARALGVRYGLSSSRIPATAGLLVGAFGRTDSPDADAIYVGAAFVYDQDDPLTPGQAPSVFITKAFGANQGYSLPIANGVSTVALRGAAATMFTFVISAKVDASGPPTEPTQDTATAFRFRVLPV